MGKLESEMVENCATIHLSLKAYIVLRICQLIPFLKKAIDEKINPVRIDIRGGNIPWIENGETRRVIIFNFPLSLRSLDSIQLEKLKRALHADEVTAVVNHSVYPELLEMTDWTSFFEYTPERTFQKRR